LLLTGALLGSISAFLFFLARAASMKYLSSLPQLPLLKHSSQSSKFLNSGRATPDCDPGLPEMTYA
jgi:hypothetical protein